MMQHDTAGDPMTGLKWTRRTTTKIAVELGSVGIEVSDRTVARLLKKMAADPMPYLRKTEQLVAERSTDSYRQAAEMLADLREALAGSKKSGLAEKQALKLKIKNPKLNRLTGALREQGFVPK